MIKLRLFAQLSEMIKNSELYLYNQQPVRCLEVVSHICENYPQTESILKHSALAKNGGFASPNTLLEDGDELAILPPVSGG